VNKMFIEGDYVYIPADTLLFLFEGRTCDYFVKCQKVPVPTYLMFLRENKVDSTYCDVFYEGAIWSVPGANIYEREQPDEEKY